MLPIANLHSQIVTQKIFETTTTTMAESDSDFEPPTQPLNSPPAQNLRRKRSTPPPKNSAKRRIVTTGNKGNKQVVRLPTKLIQLKPMLNHVKKRLQGKDIDATFTLRVLRAILMLQIKYAEEKKKRGA